MTRSQVVISAIIIGFVLGIGSMVVGILISPLVWKGMFITAATAVGVWLVHKYDLIDENDSWLDDIEKFFSDSGWKSW